MKKSLMLFVLLLIMAACSTTSEPAEKTKEFFRHVEEGEVDDAIGMLASNITGSLGDEKIRAALLERTKEISSKGGIEQIEITEEEIKKSTAELKVKLVFGNGETEEDSATLVKENGEWKIGLDKN